MKLGSPGIHPEPEVVREHPIRQHAGRVLGRTGIRRIENGVHSGMQRILGLTEELIIAVLWVM